MIPGKRVTIPAVSFAIKTPQRVFAWPQDPQMQQQTLDIVQEPWGDRRQELVLIGQNMDQIAICRGLDSCLLTSSEVKLGMDRWKLLHNPFDAYISGSQSDRIQGNKY